MSRGRGRPRKINVETQEIVNNDSKELSRKDFLRESLIEHINEISPEIEHKFNMSKVSEPNHTRGSFRDFMDGDFKPEDKKIFREILRDLKQEGILLHVGGSAWARLK